MTPKLPDYLQKKLRCGDEFRAARAAAFANLDDEDLVTAARFWMDNCKSPPKLNKELPTCDATVWHIIIPELIDRIDKHATKIRNQITFATTKSEKPKHGPKPKITKQEKKPFNKKK